MNGLVEHYRMVNWDHGHQTSCAYGAGADCNCSKGEFRGFIIEVFLGNRFVTVEAETQAQVTNRLARQWERSGYKIRYTTKVFHSSNDTFGELQAEAESWKERIEDWNTD